MIVIKPSILQTSGALCATRCPSRGRMGDLCSGSREQPGRLVCRCQCGCVSGLRSVGAVMSGLCSTKRALADKKGNRATNMLIDQNNANVFPLLGKPVEGCLDDGGLCLRVDDQEVFLVVGRWSDVLWKCQLDCSCRGSKVPRSAQTHPNASKKQTRDGVL